METYSLDQIRHEKQDDTARAWGDSGNEDFKDDELRIKVTSMINRLGIRPNMRGYFYLREAIILNVNDPDILISMTKIIYPSIAKKFNTSSAGVERAIRHAIEVAWDKGELRQCTPGYSGTSFKTRPKNSEVITVIADYLEVYG